MAKGFIFDSGKCVRCNSCRAACMLENGMGIKVRRVYTWNEDAISGLAVFNFSLACNHCENPSCMKACPANCYSRDETTGAILLDQEKCLGCKYCAWNCPYKAPGFNRHKGIVEKCNLCYSAVRTGELPACVNACPTGALGYGDIPSQNHVPEWFPLKQLNPSISFGNCTDKTFRTVPADKFETLPGKKFSMRWKNSDTSLLVFTFLITIFVSIVSASLLKGNFPDIFLIVLLPLAAALSSLLHLGNWWFCCWRGACW